jgi:hypothetical protein
VVKPSSTNGLSSVDVQNRLPKNPISFALIEDLQVRPFCVIDALLRVLKCVQKVRIVSHTVLPSSSAHTFSTFIPSAGTALSWWVSTWGHMWWVWSNIHVDPYGNSCFENFQTVAVREEPLKRVPNLGKR